MNNEDKPNDDMNNKDQDESCEKKQHPDDTNADYSSHSESNLNDEPFISQHKGPFIEYRAIPSQALLNFNLIFTNPEVGQGQTELQVYQRGKDNRPMTGTSPVGLTNGNDGFTSPRELTDLDENFMEYFHRQLENIDSVDDALGEIDSGYDFTDRP